jgi:hypothetical protein
MYLVACASTDVGNINGTTSTISYGNKYKILTICVIGVSGNGAHASKDSFTYDNALTKVDEKTSSGKTAIGDGITCDIESRYITGSVDYEKVSGTSHFTSSKNRRHFLFL